AMKEKLEMCKSEKKGIKVNSANVKFSENSLVTNEIVQGMKRAYTHLTKKCVDSKNKRQKWGR
ncbi:MAG: hypothetical protein ABW168_04655, partial [Sedimenticola sp.]